MAKVLRFQKKAVPIPLATNPGKGCTGSTAFTRAGKSWVEHFDLVSLLASVLDQQGHPTSREGSWVEHEQSGFILLPQIVELQPLDDGGVRTTTTIQANHSVLASEGLFEYQHATGSNVEESLRQGFDQWAKTDLVALLDVLQPKPEICTALEMEFPEKEENAVYARRAILGPVTHVVENSNRVTERNKTGGTANARGAFCETHEFCPCCLLTSSFEAFRELLESKCFYGVRLFAMRDGKGKAQADCRVNGSDWEKGAEALRHYVATWPEAGFEMRKQYVVLHTINTEI